MVWVWLNFSFNLWRKSYYIFISFKSCEPFPGSLWIAAWEFGNDTEKHNMLMCCSLYYNDIAHLDPSDSLICTMVVGREGSTVTESGIIGCSSLSSLSPPPTAPSSPPFSSFPLLSIVLSLPLLH